MNPCSTNPTSKFGKLTKLTLQWVSSKVFDFPELDNSSSNVLDLNALENAMLNRDVPRIFDLTCHSADFVAAAGGYDKACGITRKVLTFLGNFTTESDRTRMSEYTKFSNKKYGVKWAGLFRETMNRQCKKNSEKYEIMASRRIKDECGPKMSFLDKFKAVGFDPEKCCNVLDSSCKPPTKLLTIKQEYATFLGLDKNADSFKEKWDVWHKTTASARLRLKVRACTRKKAEKRKRVDCDDDEDPLVWSGSPSKKAAPSLTDNDMLSLFDLTNTACNALRDSGEGCADDVFDSDFEERLEKILNAE